MFTKNGRIFSGGEVKCRHRNSVPLQHRPTRPIGMDCWRGAYAFKDAVLVIAGCGRLAGGALRAEHGS